LVKGREEEMYESTELYKASSTNSPPLLEVRGVSKTFNGVVRALDNVSVEIREREIVAVVGENGAGKSTLMKILVGVYRPDKGELYYKGRKVSFPKNPRDALRLGISIVYQEKGVIPHLRVYQYMLLGLEEKFRGKLGLKTDEMRRVTSEVLEEFDAGCDIYDYMYELPLSKQKLVEIARAILLVRLEHPDAEKVNPIIILDEPTAPLSREEREELFSRLLEMKKSTSFVFVSHIIPEVMQFGDRVYVLRDGQLIAHHDLSKEKITEEQLFREIVGRASHDYLRTEYIYRELEELEKRPVVLSVRNLTKKGYYQNISFDLHKGECIGFFGPAGCGKSELARTIYGITEADSGEIMVNGKRLGLRDPPYKRLKAGIGYFSGETGKELFLYWPIRKNISIVNIGKVIKKPLKIVAVIDFRAERGLAEKIMKKLRIRAPSVETECYSLSGGNKQKVSVGKWLERSPEILVLEDPTIGIDVGAREDIYQVLLEMKKSGISMILVSDDPKEYAILCDKIIALKQGNIDKVYTNEEFRKVMEL